MRVAGAFVGAVLSLFISAPSSAGLGGDSSAPPPAVVLQNARSVTTRNSTGGIQRLTTIPTTSAFAQHAGGPRATCQLTADRDDFTLSNGDQVPKGTVVTSNYLFVEGIAAPFDIPPSVLPDDVLGLPTKGPLEAGTRTFSVFCDRTFYNINFRGFIEVPLLDPLFAPRTQLEQLRNDLQLLRPTIFTNPIVDEFGGLVTRYPTWLAINPDAWRTQTSTPRTYRGATLFLTAQPRQLDFIIEFTPNPDKPSTPFRGIIGCIPGEAAVDDGNALPAFPLLPDQTEPGVNGSCMWTPPGPGTVTITARVTYDITFYVNGYTEPDNDYTWTSEPTTFDTGELIAVNTTP